MTTVRILKLNSAKSNFYRTSSLKQAKLVSSLFTPTAHYFNERRLAMLTPFLLDAVAYDNFDLTSPFITLLLIVWSMFAGIGLAAVGSVYSKRVLGSAVRGLLKAEATSPESAKTLAEIGCDRNPFVKLSLRNETSVLRKSVFCADGENYFIAPDKAAGMFDKSEEQSADTSSNKASDTDKTADESKSDALALKAARDKLTFPQKLRLFFTGDAHAPVKADVENGRFYIPESLAARAEIRYEKKGTDLFMFGVTVIAFFIIALLAERYIPELLSMLDGFLTNIKG